MSNQLLHIADGNIGDFKTLELTDFGASIDFGADAKTGVLKSLVATLSDTANTVTTVTLPDNVRGFRLFPRANAIRFAVGENTVAVGTSSSTTVAASVFTVGGIAKADMWETRLISAGASRTLRLSSATASVVVDIEVF